MSEFKIVGNTIKFKYINPKAKLKALTLNMTEDNELIQKLLALKPEDREPILNYIALHGKDLDIDTSSDLQKVSLSDKSPNSIYEKRLDLEKRKQFLEQAQKKLEDIKDRDEQQNRQLEDIKNEKQMIINELNSLNIGNISTASISSVGNLLISDIKTFSQLTDQLKKWFGENGQLQKDFKVGDLPTVLNQLKSKIEALTKETTEQKKITDSLSDLSKKLNEFIEAAKQQNQPKAEALAKEITDDKQNIFKQIEKLDEKVKTIETKIDKISLSINSIAEIKELKNKLNEYVENKTIPDDIYEKLDEQIHFDDLMKFYNDLTNGTKYYYNMWFGRGPNKDTLDELKKDTFEEYYLPFDLHNDQIRSKVYTEDKKEIPNIYIKSYGAKANQQHPINFFEVVKSIYDIYTAQKSKQPKSGDGLKDWLTSKNVKTSISKQDERQSRNEARLTNIESMIKDLREQIKELKSIKQTSQQTSKSQQKPSFLAPSASQRSWLNDVMNFSKNKLNKIETNQPYQPKNPPLQENPNDILNKVFERRKDIEPDEYETSDDDWID